MRREPTFPWRPIMRYFTLLAGLCFSGSLLAGDATRTPPPEASDMQALFNGKDLSGWNGDTPLWNVKDGVPRGETTKDKAAKGNTFIIWKNGVLKDFDLRLSFRMNASNNSGIQYRSKHISEGKVSNAWVVRGYQHELRNEKKFPNTPSFIYDEGGKRGRMCHVGERVVWTADAKKDVKENFMSQDGFDKLMRVDDWNDVVILAKGKNIKHYGADHVIWGTDCLWWGSPQWVIDAFKRFQISDEMCEKFGYKKLTKEDKAKILGLNAAKLYKVDVNAKRKAFPADTLERIKQAYLDRGGQRSNAAYGWVRAAD